MHHGLFHPAFLQLLGEFARATRQLATSTSTARFAVPAAVLAATLALFAPALADTVLYRVNVGGAQVAALDAGPAWSADNNANPSPYVNWQQSGNWFGGTDQPMGAPHVSVPAYVPAAVFADERWDLDSSPEMQWEFPVANGTYRVNLLHGEGCGCATFANGRIFDVASEGAVVNDDFDIFAHFGAYTPGAATFLTTVNDGSLSLEFRHGAANAPSIRGIEVIAVDVSQTLESSRSSIGFGNVFVDSTSAPQQVTLTHLGSPGDPAITITGVSATGPFTHTLAPQTLAPGQTRNFLVRFAPTSLGAASGTLTITHSGSNSPLSIALSGTGVNVPPIGFGKSYLQDVVPSSPTSLQFGPDGRLYVAELSGNIVVMNVTRQSANLYRGSVVNVITSVHDIPNHDDDGQLNPAQNTRLVTDLLVVGTATNPVIYVCSSDPRINVPGAPGLDTNSGILSRLTWDGSTWVKKDLVRGLPRSKNDHASNGMVLDTLTNTLYLAQGGQTNMGAPSNNFSLLPEYALSGAILSVNLTAIGETTYDLPTLDDESRPGVNDANDPFGGNFGKNQAKLVPGGPVLVYSPGYRNPYDLVLATNGKMYTVDNGPNSGWGGPPAGEGPAGTCTNAPQENDAVSLQDNLHVVTAGFYGGHPNPTRASTSNTFNGSNPQSPVPSGDARQCDYEEPGTDGSLAQFPQSTNGLCEYRASNLGNALKGNLLAVSFSNEVHRIVLDGAGTAATLVEPLFSNVGNLPLDVIAQGDAGPFPGTIWVCNFGSGLIAVYEPSDYDGAVVECTGADDAGLDEDGDGYTNADEIDNGTSPCSAGDVPADFDGDFVSDRNDPDDDNDGLDDTRDAFAIDAANGATALPVVYSWDAGNPGFGLLGLGFTGLMADSTTDYLARFDPVEMTAGGAAGKVTIDHVPAGDARGALNTQQYAFQFGIATDSTDAPFLARTRLSTPYFNGANPTGSQSQGFYLGAGADDDYLKIAITNVGGAPGIEVVHEVAGVVSANAFAVPGLLAGAGIDVQFLVNPAAGTVQPRYAFNGGGLQNAGAPVALVPGSKLWSAVKTAAPLAIGIIATSRGSTPFAATWDFVDVIPASSVGVGDGTGRPTAHALGTPRPNPSLGTVRMDLALASATHVELAVFDVAGRRVRTLARGPLAAGTHPVTWDGRDDGGRALGAGVYLVRANAGGRMLVQRVLRVR